MKKMYELFSGQIKQFYLFICCTCSYAKEAKTNYYNYFNLVIF